MASGATFFSRRHRPDIVASAAVTTEPVRDEPDRLLEALEPVLEKYRDTRARRESLALIRAVRLARDLETCEAILRGEHVPRSRLDPEWARRYGL
jgi:hypothetical protein